MLEQIGAGRFGPVYRAQYNAAGAPAPSLEGVVAVKVFDQDLTLEQATMLAAALERLCEAPLDHPSLVPVIAAGVTDGRAWLAEPWFDAVPLDASLLASEEPQPLADVVVRLTQIAGALDFAAAAGIHHGALHPREVLISAAGTRLTGVGVLEAMSEAGLDVPMDGDFVSPQRLIGLPPAARDDIYSLAAITYELVYGTPVPLPAALPQAMTRLTGIDHQRFVEVMRGALSKEPDERPATALEFAAALQGVLVENMVAGPVAEAAPPVMAADIAADEFPLRAEPAPMEFPLREEPARIEFAMHLEPAPTEFAMRSEPAPIEFPLSAEPAPSELPRPVETPPVEVRITDPEPLRAARPELSFGQRAEPEPERTSRWLALSATLAIGLLTGFASGFFVGQRDATPVPHSAERPVSRSQRAAEEEKPAPTAGQDFTESNVPQQPVSDDPVVPPPEPTSAAPAQSLPASQAERRDVNVPTAPRPPAAPSRTSEAGPASLLVDSRPQGASVFIDGRLVGRTPLSLPDVSPGAHAVRIDLSGYRRWVASVEVAAGTRQRVAASLER